MTLKTPLIFKEVGIEGLAVNLVVYQAATSFQTNNLIASTRATTAQMTMPTISPDRSTKEAPLIAISRKPFDIKLRGRKLATG